jgi:hypothetical protein
MTIHDAAYSPPLHVMNAFPMQMVDSVQRVLEQVSRGHLQMREVDESALPPGCLDYIASIKSTRVPTSVSEEYTKASQTGSGARNEYTIAQTST